VIAVSNLTGEGISGLCARIAAALSGSAARRSAPFLVTARHAAHLEKARSDIASAATVLGPQTLELAASDLRAALRQLRAVVGADDGDPVLDRIFREFCIGK
jgi:tRNA U34 5-carboxymethylaminomethyl modifying GTPase MnmE/TrmE